MKQITILLILLCGTLNTYSQLIKNELDKIKSVQDASDFYHDNVDKYQISRHSLNSGNKLNQEKKEVLDKSSEETFKLDSCWYRVLSSDKYSANKLRYIYFDGSRLSYEEIDLLRDSVINLYSKSQTEENFIDLNLKFSMDYNEGGLIAWVNPSFFVKIFSKTVGERKKGEIFKVDIPDKKWYYVVLKLENEKNVMNVSYLKVCEN